MYVCSRALFCAECMRALTGLCVVVLTVKSVYSTGYAVLAATAASTVALVLMK